jgi:hypothetical protein
MQVPPNLVEKPVVFVSSKGVDASDLFDLPGLEQAEE